MNKNLSKAREDMPLIVIASAAVLVLALCAGWVAAVLARNLSAAAGNQAEQPAPHPQFNIEQAEEILGARGLLQ